MFGLLESVGGLKGRTDLFADWALPSFLPPSRSRLPLSVPLVLGPTTALSRKWHLAETADSASQSPDKYPSPSLRDETRNEATAQ